MIQNWIQSNENFNQIYRLWIRIESDIFLPSYISLIWNQIYHLVLKHIVFYYSSKTLSIFE